MSLVIKLKQIIHQNKVHHNYDKYFLFQLKDEIKVSKVIKKNRILNDPSKYQFELETHNNRLEI